MYSSDAAGLNFDAQALRREDAVDGTVAAVEDHSVSLQETLGKAKGVLSRLREDLTPKASLIDNLDDLVESFAGGIPMDFKNSQRPVSATMVLARETSVDRRPTTEPPTCPSND